MKITESAGAPDEPLPEEIRTFTDQFGRIVTLRTPTKSDDDGNPVADESRPSFWMAHAQTLIEVFDANGSPGQLMTEQSFIIEATDIVDAFKSYESAKQADLSRHKAKVEADLAKNRPAPAPPKPVILDARGRRVR